jgi:diacylglycerol kinase (ATP)
MLHWIKGRWQSFGYALKGVAGILSSGTNMLIMLLAVVVVIGAGIYFNIDKHDWALVIIAFTMVIVAEGFNTAIERLTDLVHPHHHPKAGQVKDIASGGVLLAVLGSVVIAWAVFGKYLW